jgi:LemA protein
MRRLAWVVSALLVLLAVVVLDAGARYNRLVMLDERVAESWSQVENVYQRRFDLVPNLVETVQGAASFERETLEAVTTARARTGEVRISGAPSADELHAFETAQAGLDSALGRLLVIVEAYPHLTATAGFRDLQVQLEGTENRIAVERARYNAEGLAYNTYRRSVPTVLYVSLMGFDEVAYFEAQGDAASAPAVNLRTDG